MDRWNVLQQDNNIKVVATPYEISTDEHGTRFVTLTSGGEEKEGSYIPVLYVDELRAWDEFETVLLRWLGGRRLVHLRHAPTLERIVLYKDSLHGDFRAEYCFVYCRLTAY